MRLLLLHEYIHHLLHDILIAHLRAWTISSVRPAARGQVSADAARIQTVGRVVVAVVANKYQIVTQSRKNSKEKRRNPLKEKCRKKPKEKGRKNLASVGIAQDSKRPNKKRHCELGC